MRSACAVEPATGSAAQVLRDRPISHVYLARAARLSQQLTLPRRVYTAGAAAEVRCVGVARCVFKILRSRSYCAVERNIFIHRATVRAGCTPRRRTRARGAREK
jgi:hypothetical protein